MAFFLLLPAGMRSSASLAMLCLLCAPGCVLVFDDPGDDVCALGAPEPASAIAPQRNPDTLTCDSFGVPCDPSCGPCPLAAEQAPIPSWGFCFSPCESMTEAQCAAAPECRVVKDAACAVRGDCATDFIGCFPTDQATDPQLECTAATDGWTCSRSAGCTAYHRSFLHAATAAEVARTFALCAPEGAAPGRCYGQVTCRAAAPACPANTRPGVAGGCYTGACVPIDVCEPQPAP